MPRPKKEAVKELVPNIHEVPKDMWGKWNDTARFVFNDVYSSMQNDPKAFMAPGQSAIWEKLEKVGDSELLTILVKRWTVEGWNAACTAAFAVMAAPLPPAASPKIKVKVGSAK